MKYHIAFNAVMLLAVATFGAMAVGEAYMLKAISDGNKAQLHTMVCFDFEGQVTHGDAFKECRTVAIRELAR